MLSIFIPSYNRVELLIRSTLAAIPHNLLKYTFVVVNNTELDKYENRIYYIPKYNDVNIISVPVMGIAATRWEIAKFCDNTGIKRFVMLDDDLRFYRRKDPSTVQLIDADDNDVNNMFAMIRYYLLKFPCVGISARQGNNNAGIGSSDILFETNTRLLRAFAFRTKDYMQTIPNRVLYMEDFDIFLQMLRQGKPNLNLYWWAQNQTQTNAPGGCSEMRNHASHAVAAQQLKNLHPRYVELVEKNNITGGEFGSRLEVRIQWKAAYNDGVRDAALSRKRNDNNAAIS